MSAAITTAKKPKDVSDLRQKIGKGKLRDVIAEHIKPVKKTLQTAKGKAGAQRPKSSSIPNITTPAGWFRLNYPELCKIHGDAVLETPDRSGLVVAKNICESFFAALLGEAGTPEAPVVFFSAEDRFYQYDPDRGVYEVTQGARLAESISKVLLRCARECEGAEVSKLKFGLRDTARTKGVLERMRGVLEVKSDFFDNALTEFIPCANGVLRLADMKLLSFAPSFRRRNKLGASYVPGAACPLFLDTLLRPALHPDDIDLLQRWCGLALTGVNLAQKILMISGTAGGGKGTLVRVITGIIGRHNVGSLRTRHLQARFEVGRLSGKTLLYGADVQENFLCVEGATVLKSLTGGDPFTMEFKGSNATPEIISRFNVVVTCNALPVIRLEGDADAWRRRLMIITFRNQRPEDEIVDFSERILRNEGPGVLNWMLEGLVKARKAKWNFTLTAAQRRAVDDLLAESDSEGVFVRERLVADSRGLLTADRCYAAYVEFCKAQGWRERSRRAFGNLIGELIARQFGIPVRHDILDSLGKCQRGWKGVRCL